MTSPISSSSSSPAGSVQGLASGVQWQTMVDQIMAAESARTLSPVHKRQVALQAQSTAWHQFRSVVGQFKIAASALRNPSSFDLFQAKAAKSATSARELLSVSATTGAVPASYSVEVISLAKAEKVSGNVVADATVALGLTGQLSLGGRAVTVAASDSLSNLRDKINAANAGTTPSGVSASLLSTGGGARLVLTSASAGSSGVEMLDDGSGTLQALGLTDGSTVTNRSASGATQSNRLSSSTAAIATLLGIPLPGPSSIRVNGQIIRVDFSVDSLATVAQKINAATGDAGSASVKSEALNGSTAYRLSTTATIEGDPADATNSAATLAALGFTKPGRAGITQVLGSASAFTDATSGASADATTRLSDLSRDGTSMALATGDQISIGGTSGDGSTVNKTFTVGANSTLGDLLTAINASDSGFGANTRSASAAISAGHLTLTDGTAGDSRLAMSLSVTHASGGSDSFGALSASYGSTGRSRQLVAGADAQLMIDGQYVTRGSNTISDAISGVTMSLTSAEIGTAVDVTIARDPDAIAKTLTDFATSYNAVRSFINSNGAAGGPLANNSTLRSMGSSLTSSLISNVTGLSGSYLTAATAGLQHDSKGTLSLDAVTLKAKLATNFDDIKRLFTMTGAPSDSEVSFVSARTTAKATQPAAPYAIEISRVAAPADATGAALTSYATSGDADTMTIKDSATGLNGSISLANGDSLDTIVQRLNGLFGAQRMRLTASRTAGNQLRILGSDAGSSSGFTIAYTAGAGGNGTAALGLAAGSYGGTDVVGTINGVAGVGRGQFLTGAKGDASEGVTIQYTGSTARSAGTLALSLGVGGQLASIADSISATGTGSATTQADTADTQASALDKRMTDIQTRLDARRAALTKQFIAMESAMSKAQSMGNALTSQINSLQSSSK